MKKLALFNLIFILAILQRTNSQSPDFSGAVIYLPDSKSEEQLIPAQVLQEEVKKRTGINWKLSSRLSAKATNTVLLIPDSRLSRLSAAEQAQLAAMPAVNEEGFKILLVKEKNSVIITGKGKRNLMYGIGWLLRKAEMRKGQVLIPSDISIASSPQFPIRGHQLGYRPKTNSYDAFSVEQFDQYIRDLVFFGANSIEIMPPRTDDDFTSRHMKLPAIKMIAEQSRICRKYGINVWMWYPNMGPDYTHPDSVKSELKERDEIFSVLPQLDELFVPGGDPGDVEPDVLFKWLEKVSVVLEKHHPKAKIWVSPQVFRPTQKWLGDFFTEANKKYDWFGGVVFGPWISVPIKELREKLDASIPIRRYPDITHSLSSQYPIPNWDLAYAMTLGRECINPRPVAEKQIQNTFAQYASGSISYSEGTNDDVNKFVWSAQDWNANTPVIETLRDYARLFIGPDYTEGVAQGIINLERNFEGPLMASETVPATLKQWQQLEAGATEEVKQNFRFQMCLLRAYYDAFIQQRLIYETIQEQKARVLLAGATENNLSSVLTQAKNILSDTAKSSFVNRSYRQKCFALADSLYKSIGAQLTMVPHGAADGRGNFIDNIDVVLNDSPWLLSQLSKTSELKTNDEKLQAIDSILNRTNAGPDGFYDNFSPFTGQDKIVNSIKWEEDPGSLLSPRTGFGVGLKDEEWVHEIRPIGFGKQVVPKAWMSQITTLYNQPLQVKYEGLNPNSSYKIRIAYTGRFQSRMKLTANNILVHDYLKTGVQPVYEFDIPPAATATGTVILEWICPEGERGSQVSEVWLIKNKE